MSLNVPELSWGSLGFLMHWSQSHGHAVGYSRGGLMTSLISKACQYISSHYGLPGTHTQGDIKTIISFLTTDSHFKYGDINVEAQTYDKDRPYEIVEDKRVKATTIALAITMRLY
ncbi:hypothetical protein BDP27DRAFT_1477997 [Rhodocollybia butyracea]|uniref:Uncharacterized protein n=1 Tax=Rhodocollybia butyracea TaxID=206335 RepID=A0A9P5PK69_9AGAR|nr:hypothetical protein BDP27DRAFT_1477997 [Rhodocollybia butyracea]